MNKSFVRIVWRAALSAMADRAGGLRWPRWRVPESPTHSFPFSHHGEAVPARRREITTAACSIWSARKPRRKLARRPGRARHDRNGADGAAGIGRGPQFRPLPRPSPARLREHHLARRTANTGYLAIEHVPSRIRHACAGRGLRNRRRPRFVAGGTEGKGRSIGEALELAVRAAITSQKKNPLGAGAIRPTQPMPIRRSAARCWSACWRRATPASKSRTRPSTRPFPTTRA